MGSAGKRNYSVVHFKGKSPEVDRERAYRRYLRENSKIDRAGIYGRFLS